MEMQSLDWTVLGPQLAFGTFLGMALGFTLKKAFKATLLVVGVGVTLLLVLQQFDIVTVHFTVLESFYESTVNESGGFAGIADRFLAWVELNIVVTGSLAVGFLLGLKMG